MQTGKIILISTPSGCGKYNIINRLLSQHPEFNLKRPIPTTSRKPRLGEREGIDYFFVAAETFKEGIKNNSFVEYENVYEDIYYGTSRSEIEQSQANSILDIDNHTNIHLVHQIKQYYGERIITIFINPYSIIELEQKLLSRYSPEIVEAKIKNAKLLISFKGDFDKVITTHLDAEPPIEKVANAIRLFLSDNNFCYVDTCLSGLDAIGYVLHKLNTQLKTPSSYIYRGITAYYPALNNNTDSHIIQSGLNVRLEQSLGKYSEEDYTNELKSLIKTARKRFPQIYQSCDLNVLADIQHNGGATCLIDFSKNILTALWFACQNEFEKCAYLYCYNILPDIAKNTLIRIEDESSINIESIFNQYSSINRHSNNNDKYYYLWEPSGFNNRIIRQDSIFLFGRSPFSVSEHDVFTILLPAPVKRSIKKVLNIYFNISESTIYNDTIGFAIANGKMKPISLSIEKHYDSDNP